jgi:hypothetical protein
MSEDKPSAKSYKGAFDTVRALCDADYPGVVPDEIIYNFLEVIGEFGIDDLAQAARAGLEEIQKERANLKKIAEL